MPVVNFRATPETCWVEAGGATGRRWVARPPSPAAKVSRAGAAARSPRRVPGSLRTQAGGSRAQAPPRRRQQGAFLAASPGELAPRGRRGGDAAELPRRGAWRGGLDPPPLRTPFRLPTPQNRAPTARQGNPSSSTVGRCGGATPSWSTLAAAPRSGGTLAAAPFTSAQRDRVGPLSRKKPDGREPLWGGSRPGGQVAAQLLTPPSPPPPAKTHRSRGRRRCFTFPSGSDSKSKPPAPPSRRGERAA